MAMDRQQDTDQEDTVCVGAQSILRLLSEQWQHIVREPSVDPDERDNRLAAICLEIHKIIKQARPCGHAKHLENVSATDGDVNRLGKALHAVFVDWLNGR